jgi:HSP20 family protein
VALPVRRNQADAARWDPLDEISRLNQQLQDYLGRWSSLPSLLEGFTPLADVEETDEAYVVEVELPGVKRDDVSVEVAGRRVTVSGERKERQRTGILRRQSRTVGRFHYEVVLPSEVDEGAIEASLDEGVLTVRVPKAEAERPRRIAVK